MAFEDLKDQAVERIQTLWARIQEDPGFVRMQERYQSLPPVGQKAVLTGVGLLAVYIVLMLPLSYYNASSDGMDYFEDNKELIENLFTTKRDAGILKSAPPQIDQSTIVGQARMKVTSAGVPEDRVTANAYAQEGKSRVAGGVIPKSVDESGAIVAVTKLNLTQIVDIGHALMTISNGVKMIGMDIKAAADDPRYFNVTYKIAHFLIPTPPAPAAKGKTGKGRPSSSPNNDQEP